MSIKSFEEINAWIEARKLTKRIYEVTEETNFAKDFGLRDQIRRASVSIIANITEGFDSQSNDEFIRFLIYSRRSSSEVQSHLYVALDQNYISQQLFNELYEQCIYTSKLINAFISYLRTTGRQTNKSTKKLVKQQTS